MLFANRLEEKITKFPSKRAIKSGYLQFLTTHSPSPWCVDTVELFLLREGN